MKLMRFAAVAALAFALIASPSRPAAAQSTVTSADVQRLQDNINRASRDIDQLRVRDPTLASELEGELDDARDEAVYLKVKLRKNESIARSDYADLRDRIENIDSRARADISGGSTRSGRVSGGTTEVSRPAPTTGSENPNEVPVGTQIDVRLEHALSSATARVEDRFQATTVVDLRHGDRVLVPAGSLLRGVVTSVTKAGRIDRKGSLAVLFDQITVRGRRYPIRATVTEALESEGIRGEAGRIGAGAGVGAIIGGILGGVKGALAGILIGGGGTIAATEGTDVELRPGTVLRVRLDTPLEIARNGNR